MTAAARQVFDQALQLLHKQNPEDKLTGYWISKQFSIEDVVVEVEKAKLYHASRPELKATKWLGKLSEKILMYAPVMDVFAQLDPQYVCLAWGATKFLLMLFMSHEQSTHQLSKSLTKIAMVLPTNSILADLYPHETQIQKAAQSIYELLIGHFQEMLIFYKEKHWKKIFTNVFKPFKIRFEERLRLIDAYSHSISLYANALAHRDNRNAQAMQIGLLNRILDICLNHYQLSRDHMLVSNDMRVAQMIAALRSSIFQAPIDALSARTAFCRRHTAPRGIDLKALWNIRTINTWTTQSSSSLLLIRGSKQLRTQTEFVGTRIVQVLRNRNIPIFFAFQGGRGFKQINATPSEVLQYLLEQAMKLNADKLDSMVNKDFNATRFSTASTVEQWTRLLASALCNMPLVYIYVDLDLIAGKEAAPDALADLIQTMQRLRLSCPSSTVKVVFVSYQRTLNVKNILGQSLLLDLGRIRRG